MSFSWWFCSAERNSCELVWNRETPDRTSGPVRRRLTRVLWSSSGTASIHQNHPGPGAGPAREPGPVQGPGAAGGPVQRTLGGRSLPPGRRRRLHIVVERRRTLGQQNPQDVQRIRDDPESYFCNFLTRVASFIQPLPLLLALFLKLLRAPRGRPVLRVGGAGR